MLPRGNATMDFSTLLRIMMAMSLMLWPVVDNLDPSGSFPYGMLVSSVLCILMVATTQALNAHFEVRNDNYQVLQRDPSQYRPLCQSCCSLT